MITNVNMTPHVITIFHAEMRKEYRLVIGRFKFFPVERTETHRKAVEVSQNGPLLFTTPAFVQFVRDLIPGTTGMHLERGAMSRVVLPPITCGAVQESDQMVCVKCSMAWDMNDQCPPECKEKR